MDSIQSPTAVMPLLGAGIERLQSTSRSREELETTARKLEGVFIGMVLKQMRETMAEESLFGEGSSGEIYGGLFDQTMGEKLSERGNLGIAEMVVRSALGRTSTAESAVPTEIAR